MSFLRMYRFGGTVLGGLVLAGGLSLAAAGQTGETDKATVPDAQVEANVLRQLASAPELSTQNIQTSTVYGTVTLSGTVHDEALRTKAENLAARAQGVKKVVDELTLGDSPVAAADPAAGQPAGASVPASDQGNAADPNMPPPGQVLQSDGTYAPAPPDDQQAAGGAPQPGAPGYGPPAPGRQPMYNNNYAPPPTTGPYAGQKAGLEVTVPSGTQLRVRINRGLDSNEVKVGDIFDGMVMYDVVANGAVAIPRGATVSGTVVDAKKAGVLKGRGELSLNITGVTLGGQVYPVNSAVWDAHGRDKTTGTVNNAVGMGILGALVGAAAGGGTGAAIGAGVGAGAGVAGSAASPNGRVILPPESMVSFKLALPATVTTVSQQEMARLSYAAGPPPAPRPAYRRRYYSPYYGYYYGPAY